MTRKIRRRWKNTIKIDIMERIWDIIDLLFN
jgi:hypothetical protein